MKIDDLTEYFVHLFSMLRLYYVHYGNFPLFFLMNFVNVFVKAIERIYGKYTGLDKTLEKIRSGLLYEQAAHVKKILFKCKPTPTDKVRSGWNFVAWHESLQHPDYLLQSDRTILAEITTNKAIFVELRRSIVDYSATDTTFLFITLVAEAVRIVELPLWAFHRLAASTRSISDKFDRTTFLFNSGRCGSTLVAKIAKRVNPSQKSLILSEPPVLMDLYLLKVILNSNDYENVLMDTLKLMLKPVTGVKSVIVKPIFFVIDIADDIRRALPEADFVYCHRDPLRTVIGHCRAFGVAPWYKIMQIIMRFKMWNLGSKLFHFHRDPRLEDTHLKPTMFEWCCISWANNYMHYARFIDIFNRSSIYYDDLFVKPDLFLNSVIEALRIDHEDVDYSLVKEVMRQDAQDGTFVSRSLLKRVDWPLFDEEQINRVDRFCQRLNLPKFEWQSYRSY